jgi:hypothetical protein
LNSSVNKHYNCAIGLLGQLVTAFEIYNCALGFLGQLVTAFAIRFELASYAILIALGTKIYVLHDDTKATKS